MRTQSSPLINFLEFILVSDDNSSVQSSPWQRDHCWKQTVPRKNINRELQFSMHFLRPRKMRFSSAAIRRKRRRPYDLVKLDLNEKLKLDSKDETDENTRRKELLSYEKENVNKKQITMPSHLSKKKLNEVVQKLLERRNYDSVTSSCRTDPGIVSPRKRILKEMEKVSLEEMRNVNKKHRARNVVGSASGSVVSVMTGTVAGPAMTHTANTIAAKSTSSHSISSILSRDEEPSFLRNLLKSPIDSSSESRSSVTVESPLNSDIRVSRPSHCSTPNTSSLSPSYPTKNLHCPQPIPPYVPPSYLYPAAQPFLSSPPISNHPPYYSFSHNYRDSVWSMPPSVSSLPRQSVYPPSNVPSYASLNPSQWIPVAHSTFQSYPVTENGTGNI